MLVIFLIMWDESDWVGLVRHNSLFAFFRQFRLVEHVRLALLLYKLPCKDNALKLKTYCFEAQNRLFWCSKPIVLKITVSFGGGAFVFSEMNYDFFERTKLD